MSSSNLTTAEYLGRIDPIDLHLLSESLTRVSAQLGLPRIKMSFHTGSDLPGPTALLYVRVENKDGKSCMHFSTPVEEEMAAANDAGQTSGVK